MANNTEVEHLSGVWLSDPTAFRIPESWPTAFMFIGDYLVTRFDMTFNVDKELVTVFKTYGYVLDGDFLITDVPENEPEKAAGALWRFDEDGNLWLKFAEHWYKFVPASLEDLARVGFDRRVIETVEKAVGAGGLTVEWNAP